MKRTLGFTLIIITIVWACSKVPISNRKQLLLVSDSEMNQQALVSYKAFLDTNRVINNSNNNTQMVNRVGERIARAATQYFNDIKHPEYLNGYKWEFNLVEDKQVNAWCMPGGKVVVYTGLLSVTQNESGLATVMGHEISHAIAKHGAERVSQQYAAQGLLVGGQVALGVANANKSPLSQNIWNSAFNVVAPVAANVALLRYSRQHESEADHLGLIFMAIAGYDPKEAVTFWGRMAEASKNSQKPPVLLSTHPSDQQRIADLQKLLPDAEKYYVKSNMR
ncbi:MAG: M48 family metallopeptidase [Siphonobacter sp.]